MTIEGMINAQRAMMKVLGIKLDEEPASWVTINGNHIPLNEEGRAIGGNPKALGGNPRVFGKSGRKTKDDFKPKNSYTDTDKYKETLKNFKEAWEKSDAAWDERKDLEEKLKKESRPKPRSEWDDHDEFMSIMGERPMIYTEEGERLKERLDKVKDEAREYHAKRDEYEKALRGMREEAAQKQRRDYKQQDLIPVQQEEYEGFTTKKTSNSFGDEYLENGRGVICEMSPKEYLERCAYEIFSGTMETTLNGVDDEIANGYAEQMRSGVKFDLPYLNYRDSGQEGRHRAVAAYKAGIDKMPVLVIGRPPKMNRTDGGPGSGSGVFRRTDDWDESKHPRDERGQFVEVGADGATLKEKPRVIAERPTRRYGDKRKQLPVPYHGKIRDEDLEEFNKIALSSIIEETGMSETDAKAFQTALQKLHGGDSQKISMGGDKESIQIIDEGLSKMAPYDGEISRGMHFTDDSAFEEFASKKPGDEIKMKGPTSWSAHGKVAKGEAHILDTDEDSVLIECRDNKTAVGTQHLSKFGDGECEVNAKSSTRWTVKESLTESKYDYLKKQYEAIDDETIKKRRLAVLEASGERFRRRRVTLLVVEEK